MRSVGGAIEYVADALTAISDECGLDRPCDVHQELDDLDVHHLIDVLRAGKDAAGLNR